MVNSSVAWITFFAPLAACVLITLFLLRSKTYSAYVAIAGILTSFIGSVLLFTQIFSTPASPAGGHPAVEFQQSFAWIQFDQLTINFGILLNPLAIMMLLVVTGVGSAIFIYSKGYMAEDPSMPRFFAFLSLFAFSMIGIVLANNFIQLFIFWELVGLSSYLLIAFWYEKASAADAGVKAFMVNRFADFGFLSGILLLWGASDVGHGRSFLFTDLIQAVPHLDPPLLGVVALLIFCGVVGKSAQVPLHVWLPDAMEGPTPVSALIHAATMVAAGIYLLARTFFIFEPMTGVLFIIACIGALTALMAATMAIVENDIKRILAYSTLSQLGLMVMALGLGGPLQGMYHLTTHAFFKALLFLSAGSVILALHHEQNIWNMQGLLKKMPITGVTFLIGTLALCGIFPLSGFWSKDEILGLAAQHNTLLYWAGTLTSGLTDFYMGRLFWVAFWGKGSNSGHGYEPHESPAVMTVPLIFLAILSVVGGFIGIPHFLYPQSEHPTLNMSVALSSSAVALLGLAVSYMIYSPTAGGTRRRDPLETKLGILYPILKNKYYFDAVYGWYVDRVQQGFAMILSWFEKVFIVRSGVHGLTGAAKAGGNILRRLQTGLVQFYALIFVLGVVVLFFVLAKNL
ncbi:MAG: NADH-quinone oxidoreductase subunit L [Candidatus Omnitrophica bacterium]|nr:NADH-quinone oxidoreductase subunit L [Candidatus Omnitrophota bacterium]